MIVYFAGNVITAAAERVVIEAGARNRLLTFADIDTWAEELFELWTGPERPTGSRLFLDSGAFSVNSRGATIDIQKYCDYIEQHKAQFEIYASLDVIGDWRGTAKNYDIMVERGLSPLPVFHEGSPWSELRRLCKATDYIGLGRLQEVRQAGVTTFTRWLDEAFKIIIEHWPVKVHLFGVTAQWVLERYPCYSADSSTSIVSAGQGSVQAYKAGLLRSQHWTDYARTFHDAEVVDGLSSLQGKNGSAHMGRRVINIDSMVRFNRYVNELWKIKAGLTWGGELPR